MNEKFQKIQNVSGATFEESIDLSSYSTLQLQAKGDLITVSSKEALQEVILLLKDTPYRVIGWGANQVLPEIYTGVYLKLNFPFDKKYLELPHEIYSLPGSIALATLTSHASKFGLKGWEVFTGIPASLGGAIFMNAGTNLGEIGELVKKVYFINKNGKECEHVVDKNSFSYRKCNFLNLGDVVYQVELVNKGIDENIKNVIRDYLLKRNKTQPMKEKTCGCVFKNYQDEYSTCRAGEYIDIMGLKGLSFGAMEISPLHANFMINKGGGTKEEMQALIKIVQDELYLQYGIEFDTEVKF